MTIAQGFLCALLVCFGVLLAYLLSHVLLLLSLSILLALILDPGVRMLQRRRIPVSIGILLHYAAFFALAIFLFLSLVPILSKQVADLANFSTGQVNRFLLHPTVTIPFMQPETNDRLSRLFESMLRQASIRQLPDALQGISSHLTSVGGGSLQFATGVVSSVVSFFFNLIVVLVLAFFIELENNAVIAWIKSLLPPKIRPYMERKATLIRTKIGQWAKGQLLLCASIGVLVFIVLLILHIPYALTLALLAAFTEFIPYAGPIIAAVPAILIALAGGGLMWGLIVAGAYYVVQWCESNLIVPLIMRHAVDLSIVTIMTAMLIGISFPNFIHPILGILISIPLMSIIAIFLDDLRYSPEK